MKYVGIKQVLKAVLEDDVKEVYIGKDAEKSVVGKLVQICRDKDIPINFVDTMEELGKMSGIEVKAATAAE